MEKNNEKALMTYPFNTMANKKMMNHLKIGVEVGYLIDDLLTDGVFQSVVLIASLLNRQIRPLSKPRIRGKRYDCDCTATYKNHQMY